MRAQAYRVLEWFMATDWEYNRLVASCWQPVFIHCLEARQRHQTKATISTITAMSSSYIIPGTPSIRNRHIWFWKLQEIYGPTFRITPNSLLINTPTGLKTIYNNKANVKKAEYYRVYPRNIHAVTTWNSIDKTTHARKRRVMNHAFSDKALRSCEPFIHSNIDRWIELLDQEIREKKWSGSLNMARWADHLVFDTLGELCFGKSFGMKEHDSDLRHIPTLMTDFMSTIHPARYKTPSIKLGLDYLLAAIAPPALSKWQTFVEKCFTERAQLENEARGVCKLGTESRKDFFHYLFHAIDPDTGKGYSNDELFGESESLIIAGSDTSAISLAAAFFYLTRYPHVQDKLAKELKSTFPSVDDIRGGAALYSCQYLRAFIDETMRMSPPVPADLAREVQEGGIVVDGQYIPKGMKVSTASYCMHHNPDIYPEPFKFRPERWIVDENDECGVSSASVCLAESAFMPFSAGPRGCVGKNLAYLEMSLALAKVVYHFEIRRDNSSNLGGGSPDAIKGRRTVDQYQLRDIFVANRDGPLIQLTKRT
ncbi:Isotrichodermin C-15 hydroxylase [Fusarium odoratissimum]|uniref:Isotrichodermin C-15 hydroxylase n=2 Tax=Fusarium oxysporum species complex TaxID=171631 RepID=N1RJR3_FUSC4|nr:Isotrichodermin C-15 hydroxylase [Fusarium odoratissimum]ENH68193.1 Isotrichodermin C-15 hydroxylase [Fusarium oxysporum f. sp. cubense race 1]